MELLRRLNRTGGRTIVTVLHDLAQACRYADHLVVMHAGRLVSQGSPWDVMTPAMVRAVFSLECIVIADPIAGTPLLIPLAPGAA